MGLLQAMLVLRPFMCTLLGLATLWLSTVVVHSDTHKECEGTAEQADGYGFRLTTPQLGFACPEGLGSPDGGAPQTKEGDSDLVQGSVSCERRRASNETLALLGSCASRHREEEGSSPHD